VIRRADRRTRVAHTLTLSVLDQGVRVGCAEPTTKALVTATYGAMRGDPGAIDLDYTVGRNIGPATFFMRRQGCEQRTAPDTGTFLARFDEDIAIELQKLRRDLYFVHAAVLTLADVALMLVAQAGGGKSTTCWALLHHGFQYLSDELGPVDLKTLEVHPYPRALALKTEPPTAYPLPSNIVRTSRSLHVPGDKLPARLHKRPAPLGAVFFLRYDPLALAPSVRPISAAEAAARLYANTLNPLAHPGDGLDGAIQIARAVGCFELVTADLPATCVLVTAVLNANK